MSFTCIHTFLKPLLWVTLLIPVLAVPVKRAFTTELVFPRSCYSPEELNRLRSWEQHYAGKKIDASAVGAVTEFLPASFAGIYREPESWGAPPGGFYFYITPYRQAAVTGGMIRATKRYSPDVSLADDGSIPSYAKIAGVPFPEPENGLHIAWNYDFNTHGDSSFYKRIGTNLNSRSGAEKVGEQDAWELFWIHRVDTEPRPAFEDNPKGISRSTFYHMYSPPEFKNIRMFNLRHIDHRKSDTAYMWFSAFRRIQRISNAERTDSIDGTDLIYDDEYCWDGQMLRNSYTLTGTRELLCARHCAIGSAERRKGQTLLNGISRERVKTLVVEVVSRDPSYIYGKRIWYVDPETYLILWSEIYDRQQRFWKCFENLTDDCRTAAGELTNFIVGAHYVDFQRRHAGIWQNQEIRVGLPVRRSMFTMYNLQKGGY